MALTDESSALPKTESWIIELVNRLNTYIVDFVNALWQKRFLNNDQGTQALNLSKCAHDSMPVALPASRH